MTNFVPKLPLTIPLFLVFNTILLAQEPIVFDGILSPDEWKAAQHYTIQYEINPGNNVPSPYQTDVFVTYTKTHLYVGFDAYIPPDKLRSAIRNRDEGFNDDFVMIGIDTYGDGRNLIAIGSNAEGSQVDLKMGADGNDDSSYDLNFESKASKSDKGYQVELKMPFNELQFDQQDQLRWKLLLYRKTYANGNESQNIDFPIDRNNSCFPCQAQIVYELNDIRPQKRFNLLPYVFDGKGGERGDDGIVFDPARFNVGLSGLMDLSNATTLEYTLNPDFSQVEADVSQIQVNETFALYYPERRPFFNEGKDIINTQLQTVYTRAINQPLFSTKMIHQDQKNRVYWLTAFDDKTAYLIGGENQSEFGEGGRNFANILRYQRIFDQGSHLGFMTTNRLLKDGGYDHTLGLTAQFRFLEKYTTALEWNNSLTQEPTNDWIEVPDIIAGKTLTLDGEKLKGNALTFEVARNTQNWNSALSFEQSSPHYRSPLGFSPRTALRTLGAEHSYQHYFKDKFVRQMNWEIEGELTYNYWGVRKLSALYLGTYMEMAANLRTNISYGHFFNEEFRGFNPTHLRQLSMYIGYNPSEVLRFNFFVRKGKNIGYNLDDLAVGNSLNLFFSNSIQFNDNLILSTRIRYSELKNQTDNSLYFKGYIARANLNYQFNNALSLRLVGEYNDFSQQFFVQPLLKWNPKPFTIFYVGGNNNYQRLDEYQGYVIETAQFYLKFQYLFRL